MLAYVPSHLHYILFELLKNSMRAVVEFHNHNPTLPPIDVVLAEGDEDISIKISDRGGGAKFSHVSDVLGIPRSGMNLLWTYAYTTATRTGDITPMAGYGHGLPLSRLYARYFGGDLQMISMQGFGTDAYGNFISLTRNSFFQYILANWM
jgi:pyruvate dehydrogenase kinase 2/3/4